MSRRDNVLVRHREAIREIAARRKAKSIALVGSVARGEDHDGSDYDFLVDFADGTGLFAIAGLEQDLEDLLGSKVDVVSDGQQFREGRCATMLEDAIPL